MSGGTTNVVLRNLLSDTPYTVTVVPVYPEGEGLRQAEKGKTREWSLVFVIPPLVIASRRHFRFSFFFSIDVYPNASGLR